MFCFLNFQYQLAHNPLLMTAFCTTVFSIAFFNFAGISVTKEMSATTRLISLLILHTQNIVINITLFIILYTLRKHRGQVTKLGGGRGCNLGVNEGKGRGEKRPSFGVHRLIPAFQLECQIPNTQTYTTLYLATYRLNLSKNSQIE